MSLRGLMSDWLTSQGVLRCVARGSGRAGQAREYDFAAAVDRGSTVMTDNEDKEI